MTETFRKWIYAKPIENNTLRLEQFEQIELPLPELDDGEALVRVKLVNIHSATRMRMASGATKLGETDLANFACAEVIRSRDPTFQPGDVIACQAGWQDHQVIRSQDGPVKYARPHELVKALNRGNSQWCYVFRPALVRMWPTDVLMEMFGTSGLTAYFGLRECGPIQPQDTVAVAGATGSVGSIAAQLAKIAGARVVGFGGGADRCQWAVNTLGLDACLDYRAEDFEAQLAAACPLGVDVFSDGVGGTLTDIVTRHMNRHGRLFSYGGAAAAYAEAGGPPSGKRLTIRQSFGITEAIETRLKERNIKSEAWIVDLFYHERLKAEDDLSRLLFSGALKPVTNVVEGFENLPQAVVNLYQDGRSGKLQVRFKTD